MSIGYVPKRPSGLDPEALFFQAVWDQLWGGQARVNQVPGARVSRTTRGSLLVPTARNQVQATAGLLVKIVKIVEITHDAYFVAIEVAFTSGGSVSTVGSNFNIAKKFPHRKPGSGTSSEVIDTITITYTWADENNRTADDGTNTETQVCFPQFRVNDYVPVARCNNTGVFVDSVELIWLDMAEHVWARRYTQ